MLEFIIIIIAGFLGGFVGAQVGSGAMITLPALLFLGLSPVLAIGTNILSGWLINVVAFLKYLKSGKIVLEAQTASFSVVAFIGALIGAQLLLYIDKSALTKIVAVFFFALVVFILKKPPIKSAEGKVIKQWHIDVAAILAFIVGIYGGFFLLQLPHFLCSFLFICSGKACLKRRPNPFLLFL